LNLSGLTAYASQKIRALRFTAAISAIIDTGKGAILFGEEKELKDAQEL
jgi:hypothetical protein